MKPEGGPSHVTAFENTDFSLTHFGPNKTYLVVRSYLQALIVPTGSYNQTDKASLLKGKVKILIISQLMMELISPDDTQ